MNKPTIPNLYARFKTIHTYHSAIAQLFWAIEQSITGNAIYVTARDSVCEQWDDEYLVQTVRDVLHAHTAMLAEHVEVEV